MLLAISLTVALSLLGCSTLRLSQPPRHVEANRLAALPPPSPACVSLSNKAMGWTITGIISGGIGSGAATGASTFTDPPAARYTLLSSSAVFSLFGAVAAYLGGTYASRFTKECQ